MQIAKVEAPKLKNLQKLNASTNLGHSGKRTRALLNTSQFVENPATDWFYQIGTNYYFVVDNTLGTDMCLGSARHDTMETSVALFRTTPEYDYYNNTVNYLNSFGGWFYFDSQEVNPTCRLATRRESPKVFNVNLNEDGTLSVGSNITQWSSTHLSTNTPVPKDEWIYIQAYHSGSAYKIGWRRADGTGEQVDGSITAYTDLTPFVTEFLMACINKASHLFWQPGVAMFDNMWQSDLSTMEIHGSIGNFYEFSTLPSSDIVTDVTQMINDFPIVTSPVTIDDIDVYFDSQSGLIVVDFRNRTCSGNDLPPLN